MSPEIKAVLFDSGDMLLKSIGGVWGPRPAFSQMLLTMGVDVDDAILGSARDRGGIFLYPHHHIRNEEEVAQFCGYSAMRWHT